MLIAYDAAGLVVATLDYLVSRDADGNVRGLLDFEAHEAAGGALTDIWVVGGAAVGSGTWPEFLGSQAHDFRVERANGRISALVHLKSGYRRERAAILAAIAAVVRDERGLLDLRPIIGGPQRPVRLTRNGTTQRRDRLPKPPDLPILRPQPQREHRL